MRKLKDNKARLMLIAFAAVMIGGYGLFFSSRLFIPPRIDGMGAVTQPGKEYEYGTQRSFTLISASYSEQGRKMEVLLELKNGSGDGVNEYHFAQSVVGKSSKATALTEVYSSPVITVLHIDALPPGYAQLYVMFAPKLGEIGDIPDGEQSGLILNMYNVLPVERIEPKSERQFQSERLSYLTEKYARQIAESGEKISAWEKNIEGLKRENGGLEKDAGYMLPDELAAAEAQAEGNDARIVELEKSIEGERGRMAETEAALAEAKGMAEALGRGSP